MIQYLAFAVALVVALAAIIATVRSQLARIVDLLRHGPRADWPETPSAAYWNKLHKEADRRKPFARAARHVVR